MGIPGLPDLGIPGLDLSNIDLNQLMGMLQSTGPLNWEVATQLAGVVATEGAEEPSIDAASSAQLQELTLAAQTHVVAETGLAATFAAPERTMNRAEWATLHLDALRPVLEALASTLGDAFTSEELTGSFDPSELGEAGEQNEMEMFARMLPMLAPLLLGVQAGSMVGYLAQHALGRYDLPLPSADEPSLCFVVRNIDAFQDAWSLDRTDLRFYIAIHEVVHAAERSVPWVRQRLLDLATEYVSAYEVDPSVIEMRLGDIDTSDPASIQRLAERPDELLGAMQSDRQREVLVRLRVFHAVLDGYADTILERIGTRLIPSFAQIHEAMARHRIERGEAERFVEGLLGLAVGREDYERGNAFCRGVIERAGAEGLNRLWDSADMAPTPNELDAPGLWLARIDLDLPDPGEPEETA
jgi:putative hydrolase